MNQDKKRPSNVVCADDFGGLYSEELGEITDQDLNDHYEVLCLRYAKVGLKLETFDELEETQYGA